MHHLYILHLIYKYPIDRRTHTNGVMCLQVQSNKAVKTTATEKQVKGGRLEPRVEAVETGLGKVQASSMQLMAMLEALEARVEKDVGEVRQEVAKLEYKMTASQDDSKT